MPTVQRIQLFDSPSNPPQLDLLGLVCGAPANIFCLDHVPTFPFNPQLLYPHVKTHLDSFDSLFYVLV